MKKLTKKFKTILTASLASVVSITAVITPIAVNYSSQTTQSSKGYYYNNTKFNSVDDVMKYVDNNTIQKEVMAPTSHMWSMDYKGNNNYYYSTKQMTDDALKNITVYDGYTSMKYSDVMASKGA